jgi:NAD-dependent SIR2 family protein deacetylase
MPERETAQAFADAAAANAFLVVGSSLVVYSAATCPTSRWSARERGGARRTRAVPRSACFSSA